jgi:predicted PurR-regulated permease PerM
MKLFDQRTASVLSTVLIFVVIGAFLYGARKILVVFLLAIFFAYLLYPLVKLVQQKSRLSRGSRDRAIAQVYIVLLISFIGIGVGIGPYVATEGRHLWASIPELIGKLTSGQIALTIGGRRGWSYDTQLRIQQFLAAHRDVMFAWAGDFGTRATELLSNAIWLVLIPILAIFFLRDGQELAEQVIEYAERRRQRAFLRGLIDDLNEMLAGYIRAQLMLAGLSLVVYTSMLLLMRVPYAAILGVIGGIAEFVPVVGPLVAAASIFGVAFLSNYSHFLLLLAFLGLWRLVQDYYNSPRIMGGKLELHPLAALFAILSGGELAGVLGVFLSIPIMATLRILWRRWQSYSQAQPPNSSSSLSPPLDSPERLPARFPSTRL